MLRWADNRDPASWAAKLRRRRFGVFRSLLGPLRPPVRILDVGGWNEQRRMAAEIRRVATCDFVQTPNRYFPIEPHFLVPARAATLAKARALVESVRLLSAAEMRALVAGAQIYRERVAGLVKSVVAFSGVAPAGRRTASTRLR